MVQAMDLMWFNKNLIQIHKDSITLNQNLIEITKSGFRGLGGGGPWSLELRV